MMLNHMISGAPQMTSVKKKVRETIREIVFKEPVYSILLTASILSTVFLFISRKSVTQLYKQVAWYKTQIAWYQKQVDELYDLRLGDLIPAIEASDSQGNSRRIVYQEGRKYLFIIFSKGCHACELQDKNVWTDLAAKAKEKGYTVTGISLESHDASREFLQANKLNFEVLFPDPSTFNRAFRLRKAPQIVAVNEIGKVVLVHFGTLEKDGLKDLASRLIHTTDVGTH
jgi:peroxiredoxin